jgi:hypothetical protein
MQSLPAKKAKRKQPRKKKTKVKRVQESTSAPFTPIRFFPQAFNILPVSCFHPRIAHLLSFCTASLKQQCAFIRSLKTPPFPSTSPPNPDLNLAFWSPRFAPLLGGAVAKIRVARSAFKKLLHHWRIRHITTSNIEDIVTLLPPRHPIYIVDWTQKVKYVFEASTLARDIQERLMCHDGLWEDPQSPRNPFTNLPLNLSQTISVYQQLASAPVSLGWAILAFRQVRYDIKRFSLEYSTPIALHAYRTTMRDPSHIDYQERLIDFIEYAYDQEAIDCLTTTYVYCIKNFSTNPILQVWANLCFKFYEAPLLYGKNPQGLQTYQDALIEQTVALLPRQEELKQLRLLHLRLQRQTG